MVIYQTIDGFLRTNLVASELPEDQRMLLRRIFISLAESAAEQDSVNRIALLMGFCRETLLGNGDHEKQITRVANKALEIMLGESKF